MKLFIWEDVTNVTTNWHNGGGLLVAANTLEEARERIVRKKPACNAIDYEPDHVIEVSEDSKDLFLIFPDSGRRRVNERS